MTEFFLDSTAKNPENAKELTANARESLVGGRADSRLLACIRGFRFFAFFAFFAVGALGFSAGGPLAAALSKNSDERTYLAIDDADKASCRPDYQILIETRNATVPAALFGVTPNIWSTGPHLWRLRPSGGCLLRKNAVRLRAYFRLFSRLNLW